MASYDVDFDDYDEKEGSGYNGEEPKKGLYDADLISLKDHEGPAGEGFEWIFEITDGPYKGWRGWVYSNMDAAKWKTQQIVKAISGGKEKPVKIVTADDGQGSTVKKAKSVVIAVRTTTFEDEKRAKIRTVLPSDGAGSDDEGGSGKKKGKKGKKGDDPF